MSHITVSVYITMYITMYITVSSLRTSLWTYLLSQCVVYAHMHQILVYCTCSSKLITQANIGIHVSPTSNRFIQDYLLQRKKARLNTLSAQGLLWASMRTFISSEVWYDHTMI